MRSSSCKKVLLGAGVVTYLLLCLALNAQSKYNALTNINWVPVTGSGAPTSSSCGGTCTSLFHGLPYTDVTNNNFYVYTGAGPVSGWVLVNSGGGSSGISGGTAGWAAVFGSATTITGGKPINGSGAGLVTGPTAATSTDVAAFIGSTGQVADSGIAYTSIVTLLGAQTVANKTITGSTFDGVTLTTGAASTTYLNGAGNYTTPATGTSVTLQTNGTNNISQTLLNVEGDGTTTSASNPSGGITRIVNLEPLNATTLASTLAASPFSLIAATCSNGGNYGLMYVTADGTPACDGNWTDDGVGGLYAYSSGVEIVEIGVNGPAGGYATFKPTTGANVTILPSTTVAMAAGNKRITGLANGTGSTDAAAFGQLGTDQINTVSGPLSFTSGTLSCPTCATSTGFPITLGSTSIAGGSTTTSIAGLTVNGVSLSTSSGSTSYLDGAGAYQTPNLGNLAGQLPNAQLATLAANSLLGNATGSATTPTQVGVTSCSGATNALTWISGTGFGCNTISGGLTNPMTTLGDTIYGGASGAATRLAGPTAGAGTYFLSNVPTSGTAVAETWTNAATYLASPPAIGGTAPAAGSFTTLTGGTLTVSGSTESATFQSTSNTSLSALGFADNSGTTQDGFGFGNTGYTTFTKLANRAYMILAGASTAAGWCLDSFLTSSTCTISTTRGSHAVVFGGTISATGITDTALSTAGVVTNSSAGLFGTTPLAGSGSGVTTGPTISTTHDLTWFSGINGQIADSGIASTSVCLTSGTNCPTFSTGLSGMTAGQVPIAATATTVTSSLALAGSGAAIVTGAASSTNNDLVWYTGVAGQTADSGIAGSNVGLLTATQNWSGNNTWTGSANTFRGAAAAGVLAITNTTAATSGTPQSSPQMLFNGNYWNGSASAQDQWELNNNIFSGTNGASQFTIGHSGTSGLAVVVVPKLAFSLSQVPTVSSCGGGTLSAKSNDNIFSITGISAATSCTVTFATPLTQGVCTVSTNSTSIFSSISSISTSAVVFGMTLFSGTLYGTCF